MPAMRRLRLVLPIESPGMETLEPPDGAPRTSKPRRPTGRRPLNRRRFLQGVGWSGLAALLASVGPGLIRFLMPRARQAGGGSVDVGPVQDYRAPAVTTRWVGRHGLWIVNRDGRLFALEARCTHLGCTPRWEAATGAFHCPCHGSRFTAEGETLNGPAIKPLPRYAIRVEFDQVVVDRTVKVPLEQAERDSRFFVRI